MGCKKSAFYGKGADMNIETLLLRQINPNWVREGRVTSQAFRPTPKDARRLSVSDGDKVTPQESWERYTNRGFASLGVLAVIVQECESNGLAAHPDPLPEQPEHAIIDFNNVVSNSQIERISKILAIVAMKRGWLYRL
jgi:hypothetical protein